MDKKSIIEALVYNSDERGDIIKKLCDEEHQEVIDYINTGDTAVNKLNNLLITNRRTP